MDGENNLCVKCVVPPAAPIFIHISANGKAAFPVLLAVVAKSPATGQTLFQTSHRNGQRPCSFSPPAQCDGLPPFCRIKAMSEQHSISMDGWTWTACPPNLDYCFFSPHPLFALISLVQLATSSSPAGFLPLWHILVFFFLYVALKWTLKWMGRRLTEVTGFISALCGRNGRRTRPFWPNITGSWDILRAIRLT